MQNEPFAVQIELTEGCNRFCYFCGIRGIRHTSNHVCYFMSMSIAEVIAKLLQKWNARIEFAMHGEPSLNPRMLDIIRIFREHLPEASMMMLTNGYGFRKPMYLNIKNVMEAGLNCLAFDDYDGAWSFVINPSILNYPIYFYPSNKHVSPHNRRSPIEHEVIIIQNIKKASIGTHSSLCNHCGCAAPLNNSQAGKRCAKPFRELSIRWNGEVAICCNDFRGIYAIDNVCNFSDINELWNHSRFITARKHLYHGLRTFVPCYGCDAVSYRTGLLPDKMGKEELPKPDLTDMAIIESAQEDGPLTSVYKREWE